MRSYLQHSGWGGQTDGHGDGEERRDRERRRGRTRVRKTHGYWLEMPLDLLQQALYALAYYVGLVVIMRLAGKRLAGQTTTFDLVVLIQMAVVLQSTLLRPGKAAAAVFLVTVFAAHLGLARACMRYEGLRHLVRGAPRRLVAQGHVIDRALQK